MSVPIWIALGIAVFGANAFGWAAYAHLSEYGKQHTLRIMLWSKIFAGSENFTERGWRYMRLARLCMLAFPAAVLMMMLTWR